MRSHSVKSILTVICFALCGFITAPLAQEYPTKPIRMIVPIAPGGEPPPLPAGGFYTTAGEDPAEADVDWFHRIARTVAP